MVPNRKTWRGINSQQIIITNYDVFGYKASQIVIPKTSTLVIVSKDQVPRDNSPNRTLYVRGIGIVENDGQILEPRVAGMYSGERPDHPQGTTKVTAQEELEMWCFNWHANRGKLPNLTPIRLINSQQYTPPQNAKILICYGSIDSYGPGSTFISTGNAMSTQGTVYGFILE